MPNFFGSQYQPSLSYNGKYALGSLPYGIAPNSGSSVISTGTLWGDDNTGWNLNDPVLVQNLPETRSVMGGLQYNGIFGQQSQQRPMTTGIQSNRDFYDNLLQQQSLASSGFSTNDALSTLMQLTAQSKAEKNAKKHDKKTRDFDSSEFSKFIKNESPDSKFTYGSLTDYASKTFNQINEQNGGKGVSMEAALESVDAKDLSDKSREKICKSLGLSDDVAKDPQRFKNVIIKDADTLKIILKSAGFKSNKTSITRQEIETGLAGLQEGKVKTSDDDSEESTTTEKDAKDKIRDLKELLGKGDFSEGDETKIKSSVKALMKDKTTFKAFLESAKNDHIKNGQKGAKSPLSAIFTALNASNSDNSSVIFDGLVDQMKDYAKEQGLSKEWNEAIDSSKGEVTSADASSGSGWTTGILSTISPVLGAGYAIRNMTLSSAKKKDLEDIMAKAKI